MKYVTFAVAIVALTICSIASAQEVSRHDQIHIAVQEICPVSGQKLGEHGRAAQSEDRRRTSLCVLPGMPARQTSRSTTLGDDSRQSRQGAADLPDHEESAAGESKVDGCRRTDCLCLLSTLHREDRCGATKVPPGNRQSVSRVAASPANDSRKRTIVPSVTTNLAIEDNGPIVLPVSAIWRNMAAVGVALARTPPLGLQVKV